MAAVGLDERWVGAPVLPKGSAAYTSAEATVFQGTTLRSMLLNAYGWWQMGQFALIASIVSFVLAGVTLLLSGSGLWHSRRVPAQEEIPNFGNDTTVTPKLAASPSWSDPLGQHGPCAPEPRSGNNPSRGAGASSQDFPPAGSCRGSSVVPPRGGTVPDWRGRGLYGHISVCAAHASGSHSSANDDSFGLGGGSGGHQPQCRTEVTRRAPRGNL